MDLETIAALVAFAALIIVWAFAPTQTAAKEAPQAMPAKAASREAMA